MFGMSMHLLQVHLVRLDHSRNMARFYHLSLEPTLFGGFSVMRIWGRIGTLGRTRLDLFVDEPSAVSHLFCMARRKKGRGYRLG
jgi:predicted DNA-binding WGR domain protein